MAMELTGQVGTQRLSDGDLRRVRLGNQGDIVTGESQGSFYEQVMRGNGYAFSTALAGHALVAATTSNAPAILNPPGSNRLLSIIKVTFCRTAVGTPLEGGIVYLLLQNVVSVIGTAADIVSGTAVAAVNLRSDLPHNSGMRFYPTTLATPP